MFHRKAWRSDAAHTPRTRLRLEELEARITPYVATGNAWPHPQLITISFVPDGTIIGYNENGPIESTMQNDFDTLFGSAAVWEKQFLLAAQVWADATNINFAVVPDDGVAYGTVTGDDEQGDPNIGDIRIGGFQDVGQTYLAQTYQPPPANDFSIAGDDWFNTSQPFNIGSTYDLFTVAAHEIGHALGLGESNVPTAVMAAIYPGLETGLTSDDVQGIESIYSNGDPRAHDAYNQGSTHNSAFSSAASFTVSSSTLTAQLTGLDITTIDQNEYFKFVAPTGSSTLNLSIQSSGLSLLEPRVWVYNSAETQIGYKSGLGFYGDTLGVTVTGITAGKTYYIKVDGAEATPLGTGTYDLSLSLGSNAVPSVTLPDTLTPNGNPIVEGTTEYQYSLGWQVPQTVIPPPTAPTSAPSALAVLNLGPVQLPSETAWVLHQAQPLPTPQIMAGTGHATQPTASDTSDEVVPSLFPPEK